MATDEQMKKTLATRIAALRAARNIERDDLAAKVNMSPWRLTRVERATSELTAVEFIRIADALSVATTVISGEETFTEFMNRISAAEAVRP